MKISSAIPVALLMLCSGCATPTDQNTDVSAGATSTGTAGGTPSNPPPSQPSKSASLPARPFELLSGDPATDLLKTAIAKQLAVSGTSKRVVLNAHARAGQGYDSLTGTLRGLALQTGAVVELSSENAISYTLDLIEDYEDLARSLNLDARASFGGLFASFSAGLQLMQSSRMTRNNVYVLAKVTVLNGTESVKSFNFTPAALERLKSGRRPTLSANEDSAEQSFKANSRSLADFQSTYGNGFVSLVAKGAELYALMEFATSNQESARKLKAELQAKIGTFKLETSFSEAITQVTRSNRVKVIYSQTGGSAGREVPSPANPMPTTQYTAVLATTPEELLYRIRDFVREVRSEGGFKNAAILWGEMLDYNVVENRPYDTQFNTNLDVVWTLDSLGRQKFAIDRLLNEAQDNLVATEEAERKKAQAAMPYLRYVSNQLDRTAQVISEYPTIVGEVLDARIARQQEYADHEPIMKRLEANKSPKKFECYLIERDADKFINCLMIAMPVSNLPGQQARPNPIAAINGRSCIGQPSQGGAFPGFIVRQVRFTERLSGTPRVTASVWTDAAQYGFADRFNLEFDQVSSEGFRATIRRVDPPNYQGRWQRNYALDWTATLPGEGRILSQSDSALDEQMNPAGCP